MPRTKKQSTVAVVREIRRLRIISVYNPARRTGAWRLEAAMASGLFGKLGEVLRGRKTVRTESAIPEEPLVPDSPAVSEIIDRLRQSVVQHGDGAVSAENVGAGDHLFDSSHIDSMSGAALLTFIEDHYEIAIEDFELVEPLNTLRALAQHIEERQSRERST